MASVFSLMVLGFSFNSKASLSFPFSGSGDALPNFLKNLDVSGVNRAIGLLVIGLGAFSGLGSKYTSDSSDTMSS